MMRLNKTILANKILNELRYNKRYMYNWVQWFGDVGDDFTEIRKFLEVQIETTYKEIEYSTFDVGQCTIDAVPLFKKIDFLEKEPDDSSDESSEKRRERNVISFSAENKITGDIKFNLFLYSDLKTMILGSIWVEVIGSEIDTNTINDDVYANRVYQNNSSIFKQSYNDY